jgi:NhaA family Na+:H+ antiporter
LQQTGGYALGISISTQVRDAAKGGGIGFTMSIFITNLAYVGNAETINASKMTILLASLTAGIIGFIWLKLFGKPKTTDRDLDTIDFELTEV